MSWGGPRRGIASFVAAALVASLVTAGVAGAATNPPPYDPATDAYSMASTTASMGAPAYWNAGFTGRGVDVAVIDSGVSPVDGLNGADKIIYGPDLSFESQSPDLTNLDTYGHGTFMAGLIAGRDADLASPYATAPASQYRGVAPDARIVSLKVATADGGTDISQVIAAIDWVVQHKNDNGMNIRVLNLSYSVNSTQSYLLDPLAFAIEQAWRSGIFVSAAVGNDGFVGGLSGNMGMPARDPFVVAVGASDTMGTRALTDDAVASFSAKGSTQRHVDLLTPGAHLQGLRVPGSFIDLTHPEGLRGNRYFRGSGSSQAAAMLSGAAALAIQQRPSITPSQLKLLLMNSSVSLRRVSNIWQGRGVLDLSRALGASNTATDTLHVPSSGLGTLEAARGTDHVGEDGVILSGEREIFGQPFNSATMALAEALGRSWTGGTWNGTQWTGASWSGRSWTGAVWTGRSWTGRSWTGRSWTGRSWTGRSWTGGSWAGSSLSGSGWSGSTWATGSWS